MELCKQQLYDKRIDGVTRDVMSRVGNDVCIPVCEQCSDRVWDSIGENIWDLITDGVSNFVTNTHP